MGAKWENEANKGKEEKTTECAMVAMVERKFALHLSITGLPRGFL